MIEKVYNSLAHSWEVKINFKQRETGRVLPNSNILMRMIIDLYKYNFVCYLNKNMNFIS